VHRDSLLGAHGGTVLEPNTKVQRMSLYHGGPWIQIVEASAYFVLWSLGTLGWFNYNDRSNHFELVHRVVETRTNIRPCDDVSYSKKPAKKHLKTL